MNLQSFEVILALLIFLIALVYSSVGHGGASGYLAVLAIMGVSVSVLRPSALILNLVVSGIAFAQFARGNFKLNLFWPFALGSIPMAFLGAGIILDQGIYRKVLAIIFLIAVVRLFGLGKWRSDPERRIYIPLAILIGAGIGLVSGMIGIGGGIILGPVLLLLRWSTAREAAAVSALFIFVNSAAALIGLGNMPIIFDQQITSWLIAAMIGGALGSYLGARRSSDLRLRQVLGSVVLIASVKMFFL